MHTNKCIRAPSSVIPSVPGSRVPTYAFCFRITGPQLRILTYACRTGFGEDVGIRILYKAILYVFFKTSQHAPFHLSHFTLSLPPQVP